MNVSVNWLRALAPAIEGQPEELADRLSLAAVPVDDVRSVGVEIENVQVVRVDDTRAHPNADRLGLATVSAGAEAGIGVVVGAPVREGGLYPWAP
ncbi:MAG: phenylalanine--tRNA ligase subunit beta, partial [Gemmatimonadota bacterium]